MSCNLNRNLFPPHYKYPPIILITFPLKGHGSIGANRSCHWARSRLHYGQFARLSQDWHVEKMTVCTYIYTGTGISESPVSPNRIIMDNGLKAKENPHRHRKNMRTPHEKAPSNCETTCLSLCHPISSMLYKIIYNPALDFKVDWREVEGEMHVTHGWVRWRDRSFTHRTEGPTLHYIRVFSCSSQNLLNVNVV